MAPVLKSKSRAPSALCAVCTMALPPKKTNGLSMPRLQKGKAYICNFHSGSKCAHIAMSFGVMPPAQEIT
jgi:hypothetical protein